jgi:hypothetical protein
MPTNRRRFIVGACASGLLAGCQTGSRPPPPEPADPPVTGGPPPAPTPITTLQTFLRGRASATGVLPPPATESPAIAWAGPFATSADAPTTSLPNGRIVAISDPMISRPIAQHYSASLPGQPVLSGLPCLRALRQFTSRGMPREVGSVQMFRFRTDAPVVELTGVVPDGSFAIQTLLVDGALVQAKALTSDRGNGGGWNAGTVRLDFGSRRLRDICVETPIFLAFIKVDQGDYLLSVDDAGEPQMTVAGDSYLQVRSDVFGNGGAIALSLATRLGIRRVATDAIGGTGYWNSGYEAGTLSERLSAHAADQSDIYVVIAGLNDYGDSVSGVGVRWPTRDEYESSVFDYFKGLRSARPDALIVATSPFCPIPSLSDTSFVASPSTNASGAGDNLYKASIIKEGLRRIGPPWVYIDVLMGGGWLNSSGAAGDVTNLQWFTGGTPGPDTSATNKPGNTLGGGGGGFGGIDTIPVVAPGRYSQAPDVLAVGGSGHGLLLASRIDHSGGITSVVPLVPGAGYTGNGLPSIVIDRTFEIEPATLGAPTLLAGINPNGQYPLPSFAPPGVSTADLNNIYVMLSLDTVHPSSVGAEHIAQRLAQNIYAAVLAL